MKPMRMLVPMMTPAEAIDVIGHLFKIGVRAEFSVKLSSALQRIGLLPEEFAYRRRALRQGPHRRVQVKIALAGHGAFAANVECSKCVDPAPVGPADNHAELLLHAGIRSG